MSAPGIPIADRRQVDRYLAALFSGAETGLLIELRWRSGRRMHRAFFGVAERDAAASAITQRSAQTDVYVGVLPRPRRGGGRADLADHGSVVWADCDTAVAANALLMYSPPPSMVVASGTGENCHGYWLLSEPVGVADIEMANRVLAASLSADPMCAEPARVLRPPSWNHKHQPPTPVCLVSCDSDARYRLGDVVQVPDGPADQMVSTASARARQGDRDDPLLELPPALYVEVLAGLRVPRHRKVRCPFHDDTTPSLHVYEEPSRGWYCFGCRRGGSVYDFAAELWGLSTRGEDFRPLQHRLEDELLPLTTVSHLARSRTPWFPM